MGEPKRSVPSDLLPILAQDEKLIQTENAEKWRIYLTDKRMILKRGGIFKQELIEAAYNHISSIEYKKVIPLKQIIVGVVLIIIGFILAYLSNFINLIFWISWLPTLILAIVGIILIVTAFLTHPKYIIHIVGRNPITLTGNLENTLKTIREN